MSRALIKWRLNEVMARYGIRAKDLAAEMQITLNSASNLRGRSMPRLSEETLNNLLNALNKLKDEDGMITPNDLISYSLDEVAAND